MTISNQTYTPAAPIADGEIFYLRWADEADFSTVGHGMGIDDLSITFTLSNAPPAIETQPESQSVEAGASVTFSVDASGSGAFTFQWKFHDANAIAGAANPDFTIASAQGSDAGNYSVVVNHGSAVTSSNALLAVHVTALLPTITLSAAVPSNGV